MHANSRVAPPRKRASFRNCRRANRMMGSRHRPGGFMQLDRPGVWRSSQCAGVYLNRPHRETAFPANTMGIAFAVRNHCEMLSAICVLKSFVVFALFRRIINHTCKDRTGFRIGPTGSSAWPRVGERDRSPGDPETFIARRALGPYISAPYKRQLKMYGPRRGDHSSFA